MKWAWRVGSYRGIGVYIHATFLLIIIWVAYAHWAQGHDLAYTLKGVFFVLAIFACVVLHEFGHALTAQKYGIRTRDITLLPIGGVARLERMPDDPRQEFWVAIAGPAVNVVIAIGLYVWLSLASVLSPVAELTMTTGPFVQRLMLVNIMLVIFNLLPAFPMDGGRILRSLLAMRMEYSRATHIAALLGQAMALLFGFIGFFSNPFLIFIALFVWIGAAQEASMVQARSAFDGIPVDEAMMTEFHTLERGDTLQQALDLILASSQQDFPVMDGGRVVGVLTRAGLMKALAEHGEHWPVERAMNTHFQVAEAGEMLQTAFERLQGSECRLLPVLRQGKLIGLLTMENVGEYMMILSAARRFSGRVRQ